jgi:hypothetical protein
VALALAPLLDSRTDLLAFPGGYTHY